MRLFRTALSALAVIFVTSISYVLANECNEVCVDKLNPNAACRSILGSDRVTLATISHGLNIVGRSELGATDTSTHSRYSAVVDFTSHRITLSVPEGPNHNFQYFVVDYLGTGSVKYYIYYPTMTNCQVSIPDGTNGVQVYAFWHT